MHVATNSLSLTGLNCFVSKTELKASFWTPEHHYLCPPYVSLRGSGRACVAVHHSQKLS